MAEHVVTAKPAAKNAWLPTCSCGWIGCVTKTAKTALKVGREQHAAFQPRPCPTPWKKRFKRQSSAEQEMRLFWRTAGKGKPMPTRVYECPCGGWHTTSKPARTARAVGVSSNHKENQ